MLFISDGLNDSRDHLALDEALLLSAERGEGGEALRVWEFGRPVVVAGRSTRVKDEIDTDFCHGEGVEVLRRCTGGASVVGGPGCLMYSVVLSLSQQGALRKIDIAHRYVMSRILRAIQTQIPEVQLQGICDLTWNEQKFSGNSLRIGRDYLLYHGTILYSFDLQFLHRCLKFAPRQPEYRQGRSHLDFVTNIVIDPNLFVDEIKAVFEVAKTVDSSPYHSCMRQLRLDRYDDCKWHNRH